MPDIEFRDDGSVWIYHEQIGELVLIMDQFYAYRPLCPTFALNTYFVRSILDKMLELNKKVESQIGVAYAKT